MLEAKKKWTTKQHRNACKCLYVKILLCLQLLGTAVDKIDDLTVMEYFTIIPSYTLFASVLYIYTKQCDLMKNWENDQIDCLLFFIVVITFELYCII